jgi:hypothetical protein
MTLCYACNLDHCTSEKHLDLSSKLSIIHDLSFNGFSRESKSMKKLQKWQNKKKWTAAALEDCLGIVWIGEVQPEMSSYI